MKFPFYHNDEKAYTIDDANYDCWRIIVAECDWWHKYATLCELVAECPDMKQLTRPCIVSFLNDLTNPKYNPKNLDPEERFLRVTSSWCLELASPCMCNQDKYVVATEWDNDPAPLDEKVKWSCSYDGLYCIDIEEAWPQTLVWRPSGPNWPFINPELPGSACDSWEPYDVKLKSVWWEWKVDFECPEQDDKPQYAKCTYVWVWIAATPCCMPVKWTDGESYRVWRTVRYYATRKDWAKPIDPGTDEANSYIDWDWFVAWTSDAFDSPNPNDYWIIKIKQKWIYVISFSSYITFNQVMKAIRCWLYAKTSADSSFHELNDIKYETWEYRRTWYPEIFNRTWPDTWNKEKFVRNSLDSNNVSLPRWALWTLDATWLPFARSYVLNIKNPTEIAMVVKPDTRWIDPRLDKDLDTDDRYKVHIEWWSEENPFWAITTIEIARVWDLVVDSRLVSL